ncbi:C2 domain-containing protein [Streptomyces sp. NPDC058685]|uniref:C2 domain-containing protein n=1 Tax=Streptomyces sp. NPDC058685 TaxID=3346598 RepID=UPI003660FA44
MARDLRVKIYEGNVPAKDLSSSDPYVKVTVGEETVRTPVDADTTKPRWQWSHVFRNVAPDSRIRFHVLDDDGDDTPDDLGLIQMTVGELLKNNEGRRQTLRPGESHIDVKAGWEEATAL